MMDAFSNFHFLRPWWLLLLLPCFALWHLQRRQADTTARWRAVIDPALLRHLTIGGEGRRLLAPENLLLAVWALTILAAAGPTWQQLPSPFAQAARPAIFVIKVTASMLERDLAPTRLERARQKMADLLKLRDGAPTGLVAYAGSAHLVLPPTPDASVLSTMAGALAPNLMPREGDALSEAVNLAAKTLADGGQGGSIVVFADTVQPLEKITSTAPVTLFAMRPSDRASADSSLHAAASALGADLLLLTLDNSDIEGLSHSLAKAGPPPAAPGVTPRWQEAGYWLTPLVALLALFWFRRGWMLA
jgi:Ca-activated chloride channel family protein